MTDEIPGARRGATFRVTAAAPGERLDRALAAALPALSRSRLKALIEEGCVSAGGATITDPSHRVKHGQSFAVFVPESRDSDISAEQIPLEIVFEDEELIVVNKQAGLVVHPAPGNPAGTLVNALLAHCGAGFAGIGGVRRPGIVHRLDKDTSGLMVVAKTDAAHAALTAQFAARTIRRVYRCVVWGVPAPAAGEIEGNIGRSPRNRKKMAVVPRGGKPALTRYRTVRALGTAASLVDCTLATGRTHQIRVHMAHIGHAVVGDPLYGGRGRRVPAAAEAARRLGRQALHARSLGFVHPATGEPVSFESALPADMEDLIHTLDGMDQRSYIA
jgi:23S rRNA pseudouridine1911/1915/1917 synthase